MKRVQYRTAIEMEVDGFVRMPFFSRYVIMTRPRSFDSDVEPVSGVVPASLAETQDTSRCQPIYDIERGRGLDPSEAVDVRIDARREP